MILQGRKKCCDRCGSCCQQGGPALHLDDLPLLQEGHIVPGDLVTIRQGELAYEPMSSTPVPVVSEFLKVRGRQGAWTCRFYDEEGHSCTIYNRRPVACGLFDCTAPEAILRITGKDLLTRFDYPGADTSLVVLAQKHEQRCPCPDMSMVAAGLCNPDERPRLLEELTPLVNTDLLFRREMAERQRLSLGDELFWFGRPLFQLLVPLGIHIHETLGEVCLY